MQITSDVLMIRPAHFAPNPQTAHTNLFQQMEAPEDVQVKALAEFDRLVALLKEEGMHVYVYKDTEEPAKPDAIFPNNWVTFHQEGTVVLYPIAAENRRAERRTDIIESLKNTFIVRNILDLSHHENRGKFLEGTGSVLFDRDKKLAYACLSSRTHMQVLDNLCHLMQYRNVAFNAVDESKKDIFHTNVMMSMGDKFVIICLEAIDMDFDKEQLLNNFKQANKEVIKISYEQMKHFAGNAIELYSDTGDRLLLMSTRAYESYSESQLKQLERYTRIIHTPLDTIETYGGGSASCMIAEIHLPRHR